MPFLSFALIASALFAGLVVIAAWVFRASSVSLTMKIILPCAMMIAALDLPWSFSAMLGHPVPISVKDLPNGARIIGLQMFDGDARAQLWITEGESTRLYEITVDANTKQQLRKAKQGLSGGDGVTIHNGGGQGHPTGLYASSSDGFGVDITSRMPEKSGE